MVALAVIFLVLAALIVLWMIFAGSDSADVDLSAAGIDVQTEPFVVFLLGAVATLLLLTALWLFFSGTKRGARKRKERKELQRRAREAGQERDAAIAERERLAEHDGAATGHTDPDGAGGQRWDDRHRGVPGGTAVDDAGVAGDGRTDLGRGTVSDDRDLPPDTRR